MPDGGRRRRNRREIAMRQIRRPVPALAAIALCTLAAPCWAVLFDVTNLVTDDQLAHPAQITDAGLKNAWGLAYSATSPFWVSSNGTGTSTLYSVNPLTQATAKVALTVSIPGDGSVTGQVFNGNAAAFNADRFLFVSEDGTVSGWRNPPLGTHAETLALASSANVYKGAAIGTISGNSYLYAANFRSGAIDVYKGAAGAPDLGTFVDPNLPAGYAPFNVQNLGGTLYVTYAVQDSGKHDEVPGAGAGLVDSFDLSGNLLSRVATGGSLNAPWGLAIAPSSFGTLAGALLVGNFGDGKISAFNASSHAYLGQIQDEAGNPLSIDGLWAIAPGNGGSAGSSAMLYFTAGPDGESHGLFGVLTAVPEPGTYALTLAGIAGLAVSVRRRHPS